MPTVTELKERYQCLSDARLQDIVQHPADYSPEAVTLARESLQERGVVPKEPEQDWTDIPLEHEEMDVEKIGKGMKALFFLVPGIGFLVIVVWFFMSVQDKRDPRLAQALPYTIAGGLAWLTLQWLISWTYSPHHIG